MTITITSNLTHLELMNFFSIIMDSKEVVDFQFNKDSNKLSIILRKPKYTDIELDSIFGVYSKLSDLRFEY